MAIKKTVLDDINSIRFSNCGFTHTLAVDVDYKNEIVSVGLVNPIVGARTVIYKTLESDVDFMEKLLTEVEADHESAKANLKENAEALILKVTALDASRNTLKHALNSSNHNIKVIKELLAATMAREEAKKSHILRLEEAKKNIETELNNLKK